MNNAFYMSREELLQAAGTDPEHGLSESQVQAHGYAPLLPHELVVKFVKPFLPIFVYFVGSDYSMGHAG